MILIKSVLIFLSVKIVIGIICKDNRQDYCQDYCQDNCQDNCQYNCQDSLSR